MKTFGDGGKGFAVMVLVVLVAGGCANRAKRTPRDDARKPTNEPRTALEGAATGGPCGPTRCQQGEVCCNESCGICTPPGGMCTQQFCEPRAGEAASESPDGQARKDKPEEGP